VGIQFTTDELGKIEKQKKATPDLPTYYSASTQNFVAIGRDFEGFLILQSTEQKQKLLKWLGEVDKIQIENIERDELLTRYLNLRVADTEIRITELEEQLKGFDEFKTSVFTSGEDTSRFASIVELDLMLQSLQRPLSEITLQRDLAFHEQNMANLLLKRQERAKTDKSAQRELRSWQSVVTTYPGQKE